MKGPEARNHAFPLLMKAPAICNRVSVSLPKVSTPSLARCVGLTLLSNSGSNSPRTFRLRG